MPCLRKHLSQYSPLLPALGPPPSSLHQRGNGKVSLRWLYPWHWLPLSLLFSSGGYGHPAWHQTLAPLRCEEHTAHSTGWGHGPVPASSSRGGRRRASASPRGEQEHTSCSRVGHPGCPCPPARGLGLEFAGAGGAWAPQLLVLRDPRDSRHACEGKYFPRAIHVIHTRELMNKRTALPMELAMPYHCLEMSGMP